MYVDKSQTYVGIVEDNVDPKKLGRCRVRVIDIFDDIPVDDIPWASPFKDLNGNGVNIPEKGKIVTVIFDSGNIYKPEYIYAEHYNINLEKKLNSLEGGNYTSMKSLIFDHKTQIYVNDEEGLKLDHKFNNINIIKDGINLNLKDNFGKINIGDSNPDQQSILGTNFLNWFDEFVSSLMGESGGPYFGNMGYQITPSPDLVRVLQKYQLLKDPKFLSRNVYLNDNGAVTSIRTDISTDPNLRINDPKQGDSWKSTIRENDLESVDSESFDPEYGDGTETPTATTPSGGDGSLTSNDGDATPESIITPPVGEINPDAQKILDVMKSKGYKIEYTTHYINIVGIRYQYEGQNYSNKFIDRIWAIWKNEEGQIESKSWAISTMPGLYKNPKNKTKMKTWCSTNRKGGLGIMVPAQYQNIYQFSEASGSSGLFSLPYMRSVGTQMAYRDKSWNTDVISFANKNSPEKGNHGMFIHRGFPGGALVQNWSEGCMVFANESDFKQFCNLARMHMKKNGNKFHYTLMMSSDVA